MLGFKMSWTDFLQVSSVTWGGGLNKENWMKEATERGLLARDFGSHGETYKRR